MMVIFFQTHKISCVLHDRLSSRLYQDGPNSIHEEWQAVTDDDVSKYRNFVSISFI